MKYSFKCFVRVAYCYVCDMWYSKPRNIYLKFDSKSYLCDLYRKENQTNVNVHRQFI